MESDKLAYEQILDSDSPCPGLTLNIGNYWYSLACPYSKRLNLATTGPKSSDLNNLQSQCRGCKVNSNNINYNSRNPPRNNPLSRLRMTIDFKRALRCKASSLTQNGEFSQESSIDLAFSITLRVLRNGGFIHIRTQEDIDWIRTILDPEEQEIYLDWIEANDHYGFRTGAKLIPLTEAGMDMMSVDRTISSVIKDGIKGNSKQYTKI
jgi:hypothetical protein